MDFNWKKVKLEDVVERINTGLDAIRRAPIVSYPTQIKCLRIQDISQNKSISDWGCTKVKDSDYENYRLRKGEIIMARTCSTGINFLVKDDLNAVFNNGLARIRVKKSKVNEKFLFYIFRSSSFINYINGISCGTSVQLNMKVGDLSNYEFLLPSLFEQNKIANILGTLDEKIELNKKNNETLEGIAKSLFKSWFIDFDPVKAKSEGRSTGLPKDISNLFPDSFEDSDLGHIPKDWTIKNFGDICSNIYSGGTPNTKEAIYWDEGIPWLSSGETRENYIIDTDKKISTLGVKNSSTKLAVKGSTVIASAGQGHTRGQASMLLIDTYVNQSVVVLNAESSKMSNYFLFFDCLRRYSEFRRVSDSSSSRGSLTTKILASLQVILPPIEIINHFDLFITPIIERIGISKKESTELMSIRDLLLPKLISGELKIPDAEKIIEKVGM